MATSSRACKRAQNIVAFARELSSHARREVPLLVLRLPAASAGSLRKNVRASDLIARDPTSSAFVVAIVGDRGVPQMPSARIVRGVLRRVCTRFAAGSGGDVESGWTFVPNVADEGDLRAAIAGALERGAQERQRYDFFAAVGHELRTPLASIRVHLETLLENDLDKAAAGRFLQTARREALRMGRLLDNLFESSLLEFSPAADAAGCDLAAAATATCEMLAPLAGCRGIAISNRITSGTWVALDPDACVQAFVNLVDNAIKYAPRNGHVRLSVRTDEAWAHVAVEDDGVGVASRDRENIFGLRVQGTGAARPGTGIGLAIVAAIAQRAGGGVRVTRSALGGARFMLRLPRKAEIAGTTS